MRTPLFEEHVRLGARMVDFHGWELPVWYTSITKEHMATRTSCGLFDISHMGEIYVKGEGAQDFLEKALTIKVSSMERFQVRYAFMLNSNGGIIDDLTVYCLEPGLHYMLCVNASNTPKDYEWLSSIPGADGLLDNRSDDTAMLAVQGPNAGFYLEKCLGFDINSIAYYRFTFHSADLTGNTELLISRTGYTGADGVEIFMDTRQCKALWNMLIDSGAIPCGLGARDTLRLEMGYPLHGNDIDEGTTPIEAGLSFAVDMDSHQFIGRETLLRQRQNGVSRRLRGLVLDDRGIPRQGYVCMKEGRDIGKVTSGSISPVLNRGIALAYIDSSINYSEIVSVMIRSKPLKATVIKPPFVKGQIHK